MRSIKSAIIALTTLALVACTPSTEKTPAALPADIAAVAHVKQDVSAAINAGDSSKIAQVFATDAVAMVPNQDAVQGRAAIEGFYKAFFDAYATKIEITSLESDVFGDRAFDRGTYRLELTPKSGGGPVVDQGKYIYLLRRQSDGSWIVTHDMSNSSLPVLPPVPEQLPVASH